MFLVVSPHNLKGFSQHIYAKKIDGKTVIVYFFCLKCSTLLLYMCIYIFMYHHLKS